MFAAAGLGFRKEEASHNLSNKQRPDAMALNTVEVRFHPGGWGI